MNSDNILDDTFDSNLSNNTKKENGIISYLSDIFLGNNNNENNNETYDDFKEDFEKSYENLINLSKMDINDIYKHFDINNNNNYQKQNSYNKKYSNMLIGTNNYEIDYELQINDNETITFLKSKK